MRDIDGAIAMMQGYVAQFEDGLVRLRRLQQAERRPAKRKKLLKHGIVSR